MLELTASMHRWNRSQRRLATAVFCVAVGSFALFGGWALGSVFTQPDTSQYLEMAEGRTAMRPYASRQLGPLLVRAFHAVFHLPVRAGFVVESSVALVVLLAVVAFLLIDSGAPFVILACASGLFFWHQQVNALVMPDVFYAAMVACLLLLLRRRQFLAASLMMFPLVLTRESTVLTLVCFLIAGWRRLHRREVLAALLAMAAGMLVVGRLASDALPNAENISPGLYLLAKLPWNFGRNVLGIDLWANVYPSCGAPRWQIPVRLGSLHAVGACGYFPFLTFRTFAWGMCSFGLLPLLLTMLWIRRPRGATGAANEQTVLTRFALLYGGASFLLAPMLGESTMRLFDYGWPAFLVGVPLLMSAMGVTFVSNRVAISFLAVHILLCWSLLWLSGAGLLVFCVALSAVGWHFLRHGLAGGDGPLAGTT